VKEYMAGLDLHSNNVMAGVVDQEGKRIAQSKLRCDLDEVAKFFDPFSERLHTVAVESTFNWYWLVDGLKERHFNVVLANPAKIDIYSGLKHSDDKSDAFFLAELLRLGILPTGYIYDSKLRPARDLLRRRMSLVQHRTSLLLSFKSLYTRTTGRQMSSSQFNALDAAGIQRLYTDQANQLAALAQKGHIEQFTETVLSLQGAQAIDLRQELGFKCGQVMGALAIAIGFVIIRKCTHRLPQNGDRGQH